MPDKDSGQPYLSGFLGLLCALLIGIIVFYLISERSTLAFSHAVITELELTSVSVEDSTKISDWLAEKISFHNALVTTYSNIALLLLISLIMGGLGGMVSYALQYQEEEALDTDKGTCDEACKTGVVPKQQVQCLSELRECLIVSVGASLLVPLFLHVIGSDIVESTENKAYNYLVFMGFSLIAAIYASKFISTVSDKTIKTAESAKKSVNNLGRELDETKSKLSKTSNQLDEYKQEVKDYTSSQHLINVAKHHIHEVERLEEQLDNDGNGSKKKKILLELAKAEMAIDESISAFPTARGFAVRANAIYSKAKHCEDKAHELWLRALNSANKALEAPYLENHLKIDIYYNRACYKAKLDYEVDDIASDLKLAKAIDDKVVMEFKSDPDFQGYAKFEELVGQVS